MRFSTALCSALLALFFSLNASPARAALTDEEKQERRLQFNALVENELAQRRRAEAEAEFPVRMRGTASYGYDNNPALDSQRNDDAYYETGGGVEWIANHAGAGFLGAGTAGLKAELRYINYEEHPGLDYQRVSTGAFADAALGDKWKARADYDLIFSRYLDNDPLNYRSHRVRPQLIFSPSPSVRHAAFGLFEWKDYDHRRQLNDAGLATSDDRMDFYTEAGWSMRAPAWQKTTWGLTAAYKRNESNDLFLDFNDHEGWKAGGFVYRSFIERISWIAFAGYDFKEYDGRLFNAGSSATQQDDFYYAGTNLIYQWGKNLQAVLSYSYRQNVSNDPGQQYSGSTVSAGLTWSI